MKKCTNVALSVPEIFREFSQSPEGLVIAEDDPDSFQIEEVQQSQIRIQNEDNRGRHRRCSE